MKQSGRCDACGRDRLWSIYPVRVRRGLYDADEIAVAWAPPTALWDEPPNMIHAGAPRGPAASSGMYEVWLCESCGYLEWWARDLKPTKRLHLRASGRGRAPGRCRACEGTGFYCVQASSEKLLSDEIFVFVCKDCGLCTVFDALYPRKRPRGTTAPISCRGCGNAQAIVAASTGAPEVKLPIPAPGIPAARLDVDIDVLEAAFCLSCSLVGWRAVGLSRLAHDPRRGVIKHDRPVMTGGQGGPYR